MKNRILLAEVLCLIIFFVACNKNEQSNLNPKTVSNKSIQNDTFFITKSVAQETAQTNANTLSRASIFSDSKSNVISSATINDSLGNPAFYVINYKNGFQILSADKRFPKILAYSDENNFPITESQSNPNINSMIDIWRKSFNLVRYNNASLDTNISKGENFYNKRWSNIHYKRRVFAEYAKYHPNSKLNSNLSPIATNTTGLYIGSELNTAWGQDSGFNNYCPILNCTVSQTGNTHALVGCVALALGELLYYYEFPWNFNTPSSNPFDFPDMSPTYGSDAAAQMLYTLGQRVGMDWGCLESSVPYSSTLQKNISCLQYYGFSNPGYSYSSSVQNVYNVLKSQIQNNFDAFPVIMIGIDNTYGGHEWICDGATMPSTNPSVSNTYFHMNFGWRGLGNGNYYLTAITPTGTPYNLSNSLGIIYGIYPYGII